MEEQKDDNYAVAKMKQELKRKVVGDNPARNIST
jgi:hypothetical protein